MIIKPLSVASSCATAAIALAFLPAPAAAATIVGGSDLLSAADADQFEAWLGQGPATLTNIFDKADGNTSLDFHAAANGMGATFSVIEVTGLWDGALDKPVLIWGYNPLSWSSDGGWNFSPLDVDRTAFVFNLTQGLKFDQRKDADRTNRGVHQTYNFGDYGPPFGAGFDLVLDAFELNSGRSALYSYGGDEYQGRNLASYPDDHSYLQNGQVEIFTISAVPEPETWALMLAGLGALGVAARRRYT